MKQSTCRNKVPEYVIVTVTFFLKRKKKIAEHLLSIFAEIEMFLVHVIASIYVTVICSNRTFMIDYFIMKSPLGTLVILGLFLEEQLLESNFQSNLYSLVFWRNFKSVTFVNAKWKFLKASVFRMYICITDMGNKKTLNLYRIDSFMFIKVW